MSKRRAGSDEVPCNVGRQWSGLAQAYLATLGAPSQATQHAFAAHLDQLAQDIDSLRAQVLTLNKLNGLWKPPTPKQFFIGGKAEWQGTMTSE